MRSRRAGSSLLAHSIELLKGGSVTCGDKRTDHVTGAGAIVIERAIEQRHADPV
jgi:hypothetical protein